VLGIIIGVAAVTAANLLTQGVSTSLNERIAGLGTNVLTVSPGARETNGVVHTATTQQGITQQDAQALLDVPHILYVSPVLTIPSVQVSYGNQNWNTHVEGTFPDMQHIQNWQLATGTWFGDDDQARGTPVAVIGQTIAQHLFTSTTSPINQTIRVGAQLFHVIGVLQAKGTLGATDQDDVVFTPISTARTRLNNTNYVDLIEVQVDQAAFVDSVQQLVTERLKWRHHIQSSVEPDFQIQSINQLLQTAQQFSQTLAFLLIGIAAISLTVGGIGIMNIMLVSITERTREIGIRLAIGAQPGDIRNQFLVEALTLSCVGGALGAGIGLGVGRLITSVWQLPFVLSLASLLLACGVSLLTGITFGWYPAIRASRLDPITALRKE
jgi:putative ABC transport system permease protein